MSFDAMVDNAERRNRILFHKLGVLEETFTLESTVSAASDDVVTVASD
ncbi:MAG: hypothetical protein QF785_05115 [Phycisphaeraceae bacterium]|jgi:hypothetical protein|nr:hypothetical protein [Phycisphaeraceae bacterium]MDP7346810.1 hypothetical protein [Phycisphaeraceae bacterium]